MLFEHALGFATFNFHEFENVGSQVPQVEAAVKNGSKFRKAVKLRKFQQFKSGEESLENTMACSEGNSIGLKIEVGRSIGIGKYRLKFLVSVSVSIGSNQFSGIGIG